MRNRWLAAPLLGVGAVLIAACGSSTTPPASSPASSAPASPASGASVTIMTQSTSKGTVLTNAQGKTLYWFAIDTPTASKCTGTCLTYWPPVIGKPVAGSGASLPKAFGTITRSNGQLQATYDGHPLYTYAGDTTAGQVTGNGVNISGGLWWAMTPSGSNLSTTSAPTGGSTSSPASSGGSGAGGYGY